jgi:hypothetical protein
MIKITHGLTKHKLYKLECESPNILTVWKRAVSVGRATVNVRISVKKAAM